MQTGILIAVIAYELLIVLGVGLWLARQDASHKARKGEFALAARSLPVSVVAVTLALTVLGTAHILGVFEMAWYLGASAVWFSIAHVVLLVLVCFATGRWVRRLGVTTVPEILERLFGQEVRLIVSCVMAGIIFGILTLETQGLGIIISAMTGWEVANGAVVGGVIGVLYVIIAGLKEVGWINLINAVVMYIGLVLATIFLAYKLPGASYDSVADFYDGQDQGFMLSIFGTPEIMLTFALGTTVAVVFSQSVNQMLMQAAMAAKSENTIKKALWVAAPVNGLFGVFAVVIGLTAKSLPEFQALGPKVAATTMLVTLLPGWLSALVLASFLAAILSTFAMTCLSPATILANDIYKRLYKPQATEADVTRVTRLMIITLAVIAMAVAAFLPPILAAINWLFSWLVPVFWLLTFGLLWRRHAGVAIATLVAAWGVNCAWSFTDLPTLVGLEGTPNAYMTLAATLLVYVVGHLMWPGKPGLFREEGGTAANDLAEEGV
ncbi:MULTISPECIES: sodium:solute symporter family protein [Kordiimonas]|uniref:sodium:solute symporter family protein n=1 Tax=Kordiimonas TaxID=288021 RepID=UPI00257B42A8|nr:sodium:solute symporter family protein [Kordiimonas sp. UBA4487]